MSTPEERREFITKVLNIHLGTRQAALPAEEIQRAKGAMVDAMVFPFPDRYAGKPVSMSLAIADVAAESLTAVEEYFALNEAELMRTVELMANGNPRPVARLHGLALLASFVFAAMGDDVPRGVQPLPVLIHKARQEAGLFDEQETN